MYLWPFANSSIWNTAIGSAAKYGAHGGSFLHSTLCFCNSLNMYVPAGIYAHEPPAEVHNDQEWIMRASEEDPLADWLDDSGNFPGLCDATGGVLAG
jgi:hypothetical protein